MDTIKDLTKQAMRGYAKAELTKPGTGYTVCEEAMVYDRFLEHVLKTFHKHDSEGFYKLMRVCDGEVIAEHMKEVNGITCPADEKFFDLCSVYMNRIGYQNPETRQHIRHHIRTL